MKTGEITIGMTYSGYRVHSTCCRCGRVRIGDRWELIPALQWNQSLCSHGYCPECLEEELALIEAMIQQNEHADE
jgi:hypothetical protein